MMMMIAVVMVILVIILMVKNVDDGDISPVQTSPIA
jgi:hypothetical protein